MDPLEPELRRLISDGMQAAAPDPETTARGLARLLASLPPPNPGPDPGSDPSPADPAAIAAAKSAALTTSLKTLLVVVGISAGALGLRQILTPPPPLPPAAITTPAITTPTITTPTITTPPITSPVTPPSIPPRPRPQAPPISEPGEDPLLAETLAVAAADAALTRGDPARARELTATIAREHPRGQLILERSAIELAARCAQDDPGAAAAARDFLRRHPDVAVAAKVRTRCAEKLTTP